MELAFSAGLLLVIFFVAFSLFELGTYHFHIGMMRHGLQHDVRRTWVNLDRDLRQTVAAGFESTTGSAANNVTVAVKGTTAAVHRDIICMPGLSDWQPFASTFDATTGLPNWDRHILYHATLDIPDGQLYRLELDPGAPFQGGTFPGFATAVTALNVAPTTMGANLGGAAVKNIKKLSSGVFSFEAIPGPVLQVILKVRGKSKREGEQGEKEETFEVNLKISPNNEIRG